jgi:hypothetical protein
VVRGGDSNPNSLPRTLNSFTRETQKIGGFFRLSQFFPNWQTMVEASQSHRTTNLGNP